MSFFIEINGESLNKYSEELCGDNIEVIKNDESSIVVLADGLGSGVKANILSTLTSKIIGTMLSLGSTIEEAVDTIINTLPVCKERGLAYSTFSILQVYNSGECYLVEFDNPSAIMLSKGKILDIKKEQREINGKIVSESRFIASPDDVIIMVSDGAVHAGVGHSLSLGWNIENIRSYAEKIYKKDITARKITKLILSVCNNLYENRPGDDTTVVSVKVRNTENVNVIVGPPMDKDMDSYVVNKFLNLCGKKVVCGGTTSQIISRETGKKVAANFNYIDHTIPPTAEIEGIDLTTEGVLTMSKALNYVKEYVESEYNSTQIMNMDKQDGASKLAKLLLEDSTSVHFIVGRGINPAHEEQKSPLNRSSKLNVIEDMEKCLRSLGKNVVMEYY